MALPGNKLSRLLSLLIFKVVPFVTTVDKYHGYDLTSGAAKNS